MLTSWLHPLLSLGGWEAYLLVGALCFGEAAILLGFVIPGETAVVFGGILASEHHISLLALVILVCVAAVAGDSVGYEVGRHFGPRLLALRPLRNRPAIDKSRSFLHRHGSWAVFFGRFTAVFRALMPGIAGLSELPYPRFLLANAIGGVMWGCLYSFAGYYVGKAVLSTGSTISTVILAVAAAALVSLEVRRRLRDRRERASGDRAEQNLTCKVDNRQSRRYAADDRPG